jgi:ureidoacrylate peracid hydrolase
MVYKLRDQFNPDFTEPDLFQKDYFVHLRDGKVDSFGKVGDFDSTGQKKEMQMNFFASDARKAAFVVIDMQNFSCMPADSNPMPGLDVVIERINRLAGVCRENGVPVIWVRHNISSEGDSDDGGLYGVFHGEERTHAVMNRCEGTEIYRKMDIDFSRDHVVFKNRYSAFLSNPPELREKLEALSRTQLLIAGIAANVCVESTLRDAMQLDYEVILVSDGTTAPDGAALKNTLTNTRLFFGDVQTADEIAVNLMKNQAERE